MRFAYIDSQGNEVPIPSVDALALRIELGAIGPETQLYDAQADHWGPAESHEIYHTLAREQEDEGFVPPPVAPPPAFSTPPEEIEATPAEAAEQADAEGGEAQAGPEPEQETATDALDLAPDVPASSGDEAELQSPAEEGAAPDDLGFDLDFALTEAPGEGPQSTPPDQEATADLPEGEFGFNMAPADDVAAQPAAPDTGDDDLGFGDLGSLEMEAPDVEEEEAEAPMSFGGGMELEQPLADASDQSPTEGMGGGL